MKMNSALATTKKQEDEPQEFDALIASNEMQQKMLQALGDKRLVTRLTATLMSAVSSNPKLQQCDGRSIISAALTGESRGLTYGEHYHIVPYGGVAQFVPGYKSYIQRSIVTGLYADIDVKDVRDGERKGRDKRTGRVVIDFSTYETDEERARHPIIGVKAYFELRDGFYREEYWSISDALKHADRYVPYFSLALYNKWRNGGDLDADDLKKVKGPYQQFRAWHDGADVGRDLTKAFGDMGAWYDEGYRQIDMVRKTAIRSLLTSGYAPLSQDVSFLAQADVSGGIIPDFELPPAPSVDKATGEVVEVVEATAAEQGSTTPAAPTEEQGAPDLDGGLFAE